MEQYFLARPLVGNGSFTDFLLDSGQPAIDPSLLKAECFDLILIIGKWAGAKSQLTFLIPKHLV